MKKTIQNSRIAQGSLNHRSLQNLMLLSLLTLLIITLSSLTLSAQASQFISYQTVVRDGQGELVTDQSVSLRITIIQGPLNPGPGTEVYQETHTLMTNSFGLLNLKIGEGITGNMLNDFTAID